MPAGEPAFLRCNDGGVTIDVRVRPRARSTRLGCGDDGTLEAWVTAPADRGKANAALLALLAEAWRLPKSTMAITRGETVRHKVLSITGEPAALARRIGDWMSRHG